jgi:SHS2 domain-containing protein
MPNKTPPGPSNTCHEIAFEEIEHTADWALRIFGSDLGELLLNAARGMNHLMDAKCTPGSTPEEKTVELEAIDAESLLVEWLNELVYWAETEMLVFREFDIESVSLTHLKSKIRGFRATHFEKHIKAVTYHSLEIVRTDRGLTATVVFDV